MSTLLLMKKNKPLVAICQSWFPQMYHTPRVPVIWPTSEFPFVFFFFKVNSYSVLVLALRPVKALPSAEKNLPMLDPGPLPCNLEPSTHVANADIWPQAKSDMIAISSSHVMSTITETELIKVCMINIKYIQRKLLSNGGPLNITRSRHFNICSESWTS